MRLATALIGISLIFTGANEVNLSSGLSLAFLMHIFTGMLICALTFFGRKEEGSFQRNVIFFAIVVSLLSIGLGIRGWKSIYHSLTILGPSRSLAFLKLGSILLLACFILLEVISTKRFFKQWQSFNHTILNYLVHLLLSAFYFSFFLPFAIVARLFTDPFGIKNKSLRFWRINRSEVDSMKNVKKLH